MKLRAKSCKIVQNRAAKVKMIQKRASQGFLDPIQKRALSRSVQLEAVYLEALLYMIVTLIYLLPRFSKNNGEELSRKFFCNRWK